MKIHHAMMPALALAINTERKRQKLSREEAAAVCGVSPSFIRDAESHPENCSVGKLARLINGLGLSLEVQGLNTDVPTVATAETVQAATPPQRKRNALSNGLIASAMGLKASGKLAKPDYGVPDSQLLHASVPREDVALSDKSHRSQKRTRTSAETDATTHQPGKPSRQSGST